MNKIQLNKAGLKVGSAVFYCTIQKKMDKAQNENTKSSLSYCSSDYHFNPKFRNNIFYKRISNSLND